MLGPDYKCKLGILATKIRDEGDEEALQELKRWYAVFKEQWSQQFQLYLSKEESDALYDLHIDLCIDRFCSANARMNPNTFNGYVVNSILCRLTDLRYHRKLLAEGKRKGLRTDPLGPSIRALLEKRLAKSA